ncbi:MAG: undecaprenyl-diphosphate phosphatase [Clostridia bacterium]|nr:undecaprenyl-diphosphate phosphatase [Clostridia bacterium]
MSYLQAIILGFVQGVAEFLPISSSGHLAILHNLMPSSDAAISDVTFDVLLHFGTLIAVVIVFHKTIWNMIIEFGRMCSAILGGTFMFRKANKYQIMDLYVIVTTLMLVPFALAQDSLAFVGENLWMVGVCLLVTSFLLFVADHSIISTKQVRDMKLMQAIKLGLFQGLATLPGISRSGSTIAAGINMGFDRTAMVEMSFMMSIPAVLGAVVFDLNDMISGFSMSNIGPYLVGVAVAAVAGVGSIKLLTLVAKKNKFGWFMGYCLIVGILAIVLDIVR